MTKKIEHTPSSGNVFTDLGLPNADEHLGEAQEAVEVARLLESTKLTKKGAHARGKGTGCDPAKAAD